MEDVAGCHSVASVSGTLSCSLDCSLWRQPSSLCLWAVCGEASVTELGSSEACKNSPVGELEGGFSPC